MGFAGGATATLIERSSYVKDFWSDVDDEIDLPAVAAPIALPSITVAGLRSGISLTRVVLLLKVRAIEDGSGSTNFVESKSLTPPSTSMTFSNGSTAVTGSLTAFLTDLEAGDSIILDADEVWANVESIEDDTHLTLTAAYTGTGGTGDGSRAQRIKVKESSEDWTQAIMAINMVGSMWKVAASAREAGDVVIGDNDIKATVSGNGTYNVRWTDAEVLGAPLTLNDVQVGFRMFWEVE